MGSSWRFADIINDAIDSVFSVPINFVVTQTATTIPLYGVFDSAHVFIDVDTQVQTEAPTIEITTTNLVANGVKPVRGDRVFVFDTGGGWFQVDGKPRENGRGVSLIKLVREKG